MTDTGSLARAVSEHIEEKLKGLNDNKTKPAVMTVHLSDEDGTMDTTSRKDLELSVQGGPDDSLDDVKAVFDERLELLLEEGNWYGE